LAGEGGTLTPAQLGSMLMAPPFKMSENQVWSICSQTDANNDGVIDLEEFMPTMLAVMGFISGQSDPNKVSTKNDLFDMSTQMIIELLREQYNHADTNGDGLLQPLEVVGMLVQPPYSLSHAEAAAITVQGDINGDGAIDFDEFCPTVLSLLAAMKGTNKAKRVSVDASENGHFAYALRSWFYNMEESGAMTPIRLANELSKSGLKLAPSVILELVAGADVDGNGLIDYEEFVMFMITVLKDPPEEKLNMQDFTTGELAEYFRELFLVGDVNGDGVLQPEEFRKLLQCNGFKFDDQTVERLFEASDVNGDGVVDYCEFLPAMLSIMHSSEKDSKISKDNVESELKRRFRLADKDGNGVIDATEFLDLMTRKDLPAIPPKAILQIFMEADTNEDGVLDYEEFMPVMTHYIQYGLHEEAGSYM